jgi:SAM-dependent methyltransferase
MPPPATAERIRDVNVRYHDAAAAEYDTKWGIDFGEVGRQQVMGKLRKALGGELEHFPRSLEIGSGTGYFSLNLLQAGVIASAVCTDISPGMLDTLQANAARLGLEVGTVACEAQTLPFEDGRFDLVHGHAVLHHLPDLPAAFAEFSRVLAPGGTLVFAGEPSRHGDRLAAVPKRGAQAAAPLWRALLGARAAPNGHEADHDHQLERYVDVHAFVPGDLEGLARGAGFEDVHVRGEELLANLFGWFNRGVEATAEPDDVPWAWRQYAFRGYLALQQVDQRLLESRLPAGIFYNLMLAARKPA